MNRLVRTVFWAVAATVAAAAVVIAIGGRRHGGLSVARPMKGELSVGTAVGGLTFNNVIVRGYVVVGGPLGPVLCGAITHSRPVGCAGGYLYLSGLDANQLNFEKGRDRNGATVGWTSRPVGVGGDVRGLTLQVRQLFS